MSRHIYQTFDQSVDLLDVIFPDENWVWFLSKNLHGLTEGFDTIPFSYDTYDIMYRIGDLERFAVEFGRGYISAEEIAAIIDENYMDQEELDSELDELLCELRGEPVSSGSSENSIQLAKTGTEGNVQLEGCKKSVVQKAIKKIDDLIRSGLNIFNNCQAKSARQAI